MEKSPMEMIEILPDDQFEIAKKFIELNDELKCYIKIRYATRHKIWKCTFTKRNLLFCYMRSNVLKTIGMQEFAFSISTLTLIF